jgi:hypothetical protein
VPRPRRSLALGVAIAIVVAVIARAVIGLLV